MEEAMSSRAIGNMSGIGVGEHVSNLAGVACDQEANASVVQLAGELGDGRDLELAKLSASVERSLLVTLLGVGGVGNTRLPLAVATSRPRVRRAISARQMTSCR
jgi:hypothetical protein